MLPHVLAVVGRREIAPRQRAFLPIGLAERDGETGARQLLAQVERMGGSSTSSCAKISWMSVPRTKRSLLNTVMPSRSAKMR